MTVVRGVDQGSNTEESHGSQTVNTAEVGAQTKEPAEVNKSINTEPWKQDIGMRNLLYKTETI